MKKLNTRQIALNGVVAGLYAAITILTASFAYGDIQFRIAAATLIGCLLTARMKKTWLLPLPTILANAVLVGAMLAFVLTPETFWLGFALKGAQVAAGEIAVLYVLGVPLYLFMKKENVIGKILK